MSRQRSLEQERAGRAWDCVQEVKARGGGLAKDYGTLARSAPADIQANGLGQTLAFWRAKGGIEQKALLRHVGAWLARPEGVAPDRIEAENPVAWIAREATTDQYRRATVEAMALLGWIKRFAEAELPRADGQGGR